MSDFASFILDKEDEDEWGAVLEWTRERGAEEMDLGSVSVEELDEEEDEDVEVRGELLFFGCFSVSLCSGMSSVK